jgi:hypothetical protein
MCKGTEVQWCCRAGAEVQRCRGAEVQRCRGEGAGAFACAAHYQIEEVITEGQNPVGFHKKTFYWGPNPHGNDPFNMTYDTQ